MKNILVLIFLLCSVVLKAATNIVSWNSPVDEVQKTCSGVYETTSELSNSTPLYNADCNSTTSSIYGLSSGTTPIPNNTIYYTTWDGEVCNPYNIGKSVFGANIISNTYKNGQGVITFDNNITSIGNSAFYNCSRLTSITIPNSVTSIGSYAFKKCSGLTSINIPNSVTNIGSYAFEDCFGLTSINIPNSVTSVGSYAFSNCSRLTSITIPNSVNSIESYAFYGCSGLTSITLPNSVNSIESYAFQWCSGLTSITIPNSVISVGTCAFASCSGLTSISIGDSVTSIGDNAFDSCSGLTSITIPNSLTSIGNATFLGCSGLTSITIPNSVTSIGNYAFSYCSGLTSINIPNSVTSIGDDAFYDCPGLISVTIGNNVTSIGNNVFAYCSGLTSITSEAPTPPTCNSSCFYAVSGSATLYVPYRTSDAYKKAKGWNQFSNIVEMAPEAPCTSIALSSEAEILYVGGTKILTATILPDNATDKSLTWSSDNESVATVADGIVIAIATGTAKITATTTDGTNLSASCDIIVKKAMQSIVWNDELPLLREGGEMIALEATSSSGLPVRFISSDDNIVSIFDLGDVVYANPVNSGKAYITSYQEGNYKYEPVESRKEIEVLENPGSASKTLIAYYSQSVVIDGIVAELANQIASSNASIFVQKIEPTNDRINSANSNSEVRDSVMNVISLYPNDANSYPTIRVVNVNISDYDNVIMVYPLWNSLMAAPMQTFDFINKDILKKKSIAYVEYDLYGEAGPPANAKVLRFNSSNIDDKSNVIEDWLGNSDATGILQIRKDKISTSKGVYDLQGRKLSSSGEHGLYIIKGRKIIK